MQNVEGGMQMNDFTTKDMADLLYGILSEIKDNEKDKCSITDSDNGK